MHTLDLAVLFLRQLLAHGYQEMYKKLTIAYCPELSDFFEGSVLIGLSEDSDLVVMSIKF